MATRNSYGWISNEDSQRYSSGQARQAEQDLARRAGRTDYGSRQDLNDRRNNPRGNEGFTSPYGETPGSSGQYGSGTDGQLLDRMQQYSGGSTMSTDMGMSTQGQQYGGGSRYNAPSYGGNGAYVSQLQSQYDSPGYQAGNQNYGAGIDPSGMRDFLSRNYYGSGALSNLDLGGSVLGRMQQPGRRQNPFADFARNFGGRGTALGSGPNVPQGQSASYGGMPMTTGQDGARPTGQAGTAMTTGQAGAQPTGTQGFPGAGEIGRRWSDLYASGPGDIPVDDESRRRRDEFVEKYFQPMLDYGLQRGELGLGGYQSERDFIEQQGLNRFQMQQGIADYALQNRAADQSAYDQMIAQQLGLGRLGLETELGRGQLQNEQFGNETQRMATLGSLANDQFANETERALGQQANEIERMYREGQLTNEEYANETQRLLGQAANEIAGFEAQTGQYGAETTRMLGWAQNEIERMYRSGQLSNEQYANMTQRLQQRHQSGFDYAELAAQERMAQAQRENELLQARYGAFGRAQAPAANFATGWS